MIDIDRLFDRPMTHKVVSVYSDGSEYVHETRSRASAVNYAISEKRKIGKNLISRNEDLSAGPVKKIIKVDIFEIQGAGEGFEAKG